LLLSFGLGKLTINVNDFLLFEDVNRFQMRYVRWIVLPSFSFSELHTVFLSQRTPIIKLSYWILVALVNWSYC